jgi:hypothetical protein
VDGDGLDDLLVGAFASDLRGSWGGAAYLILGSTLAGSASTDLDLADADFELIAEDPGDWAGTSVSTAGDVDGDGLDDNLVGSPDADNAAGRSTGKAYLFLGSTLAAFPTASLDLGEADSELVGADFGERAGYRVSSAGDVEGDGLDDLFIPHPRQHPRCGLVPLDRPGQCRREVYRRGQPGPGRLQRPQRRRRRQ